MIPTVSLALILRAMGPDSGMAGTDPRITSGDGPDEEERRLGMVSSGSPSLSPPQDAVGDAGRQTGMAAQPPFDKHDAV